MQHGFEAFQSKAETHVQSHFMSLILDMLALFCHTCVPMKLCDKTKQLQHSRPLGLDNAFKHGSIIGYAPSFLLSHVRKQCNNIVKSHNTTTTCALTCPGPTKQTDLQIVVVTKLVLVKLLLSCFLCYALQCTNMFPCLWTLRWHATCAIHALSLLLLTWPTPRPHQSSGHICDALHSKCQAGSKGLHCDALHHIR